MSEGERFLKDDVKREAFVEPILQFFSYAHLPEELQMVSEPFCTLANAIANDENVPRNPERTVALRKLLEAKDAAVRAKLFK